MYLQLPGSVAINPEANQTLALVSQRWRDLVVETDPDVIIGYNICNFDLPYLLKRAEKLQVADFPFWGRLNKRCALS